MNSVKSVSSVKSVTYLINHEFLANNEFNGCVNFIKCNCPCEFSEKFKESKNETMPKSVNSEKR